MLVLIDNYDSFTYNLVDYFESLGEMVRVFEHDRISVEEIDMLNPDGIVISPGPGTPNESGISLDVIAYFYQRKPILGVCLGHQVIGQFFGATIMKAHQVCHGKTSQISHSQTGLFAQLPSPFQAARYHSLVIDATTLPDCLQVNAWLFEQDKQYIMAIQHKSLPIFGVQFHPEAILTEHGHQLIKQFIDICKSNSSLSNFLALG